MPDFCPQGCYWNCEHRAPEPWTVAKMQAHAIARMAADPASIVPSGTVIVSRRTMQRIAEQSLSDHGMPSTDA